MTTIATTSPSLPTSRLPPHVCVTCRARWPTRRRTGRRAPASRVGAIGRRARRARADRRRRMPQRLQAARARSASPRRASGPMSTATPIPTPPPTTSSTAPRSTPAPDGLIPWKQRPDALKKGVVSRVPPLVPTPDCTRPPNDRHRMLARARFPCTIVTGFLGAGKTTLIRHLLENAGGRRLAADHQRVRRCRRRRRDPDDRCGIESCPEDNIVELANGCICCTVADDFVPAIEALLDRPRTGPSTSSSRPRASRCPSRW